MKIKSECCPTEKLFKACAVNYPNVISISIFPWDSILKIKSKYCCTENLVFDFEIVITLNELVLSQKLVLDFVKIITVIELVLIQTRK